MEFTPSLSLFQGVIISADSVHSFSKLTARGGNEDRIDYVIHCLRNFLQKEKYIVDNNISEDATQIVRKFVFYVVINADLNILKEMVDLDGIDFVIWTIPTIPKCLMCEILWKLNLDKFIYEILVFGCPQLALEVADALIANFKYFNPVESLQNLKLLTSACYRLICRFVFFELKSDELTNAVTNFQNCLKYFSEPPNSAKLDALSEDEQYKFLGNRLYSMLLLITECFNNFMAVQKFKPSDFQEIYELTYKEDTVINKEASIAISEYKNNSLQECVNNCHELLLDKCKQLVMDISVEIFCAWSEFDESGKSMQQKVGELCYKVHTSLSKINGVSDHPVVSMLTGISCEPLDVMEIINKTDADEIVKNVNQGGIAAQWIRALIYRDKLCEDPTLINLIANHLQLLNNDECCELFRVIYSFLKASINNEHLLLIAIKVFQCCSNRAKCEIVEEHFSNDCFNDTLLTTDFNDMLTEIFNKLIISPDTDLCNVLTVFIQSPRKVFTYIFNLASENKQQTAISEKVMKSLKTYSKHYYNEETEPCVILVTKEVIDNSLDTAVKQCNFINFLNLIMEENIIPGHKMLLLVIMPNLHRALVNKNITSIYVHCRLMYESYPLIDVLEYRAPILVMLAQVIDQVRWKINTFVALGPVTLDLVLNFQTSLINSYESGIPEKESTWLKSKLRNIHPLNMYYYRCLWNPPGATYVEVISGIHIHKDMNMEQLTLWLSQVICSTTLREWYQTWDSLTEFGSEKILDIFHDALLLISMVEKSKSTESSKACLFYCIQNFVTIIRFKFLKEPLIENQITTVFNKFVVIENFMADSNVEVLSTIFMPLFAFMSSLKGGLSVEIPHGLIKKLKHKIFVDIIENIFIKQIQSQMEI